MNAESKIDEFIKWFRQESCRLKMISSQNVADEVCEHLLKVDERLGVEVGRFDYPEPREIIFTAFSDADVFPTVRDLVSKLGNVPDWKFIPLKPPRGFDFSLTIAGERIRADQIRIRKLKERGCGFQLVLPGCYVGGEGAEEAAWLIVETGVGEEVASKVTYLEFGAGEILNGTERPISELESQILKCKP